MLDQIAEGTVMNDQGTGTPEWSLGSVELSRRQLLVAGGGAAATLALSGPLVRAVDAFAATGSSNVVVVWNNAALEAIRRVKPAPPATARALAIVHTCMYDAWACYDQNAVGTRLGGTLRQPPRQRTMENKAEAISHAAYAALIDLFPALRAPLFDTTMGKLGYSPEKMTGAAGIGHTVADALLQYRHRDGSNQLGDDPKGKKGVPYSDTSGYMPANEPMDVTQALDPSTIHALNRWQPLTYPDPLTGKKTTPPWAAPHWGGVEPFALSSGSQFRPDGPIVFQQTDAFAHQAQELVHLSRHLTDRQKMIAEYWADGPHSEQPPGHWNLIAQFVSARDGHDLDDDVKLFFIVANAVFDAGIACWEAKRHYDSVRPITAIRYLTRNKKIMAWGGADIGVRRIHGNRWLPYQAITFPTPPFGEYPSGHSAFSAAGAEVLRRFTGSKAYGGTTMFRKGQSKFEHGRVPRRTIHARWDTFYQASNSAGWSRRLGGIHFKKADLDSRKMGRAVGAQVWQKALTYFDGSASPNITP